MTNYFVHESSFIDKGATIGDETKIWHFCHISASAKLGENCNLGQNVFVADGVEIGSNVKIQNNVSVYTGTTIEDNVFLGPSCVLTNVINPRSEVNRKNEYKLTFEFIHGMNIPIVKMPIIGPANHPNTDTIICTMLTEESDTTYARIITKIPKNSATNRNIHYGIRAY